MIATRRLHLLPSPAPPLRQAAPRPAERLPLGQILLEAGAVDPGDLLKAVAMRGREDARLGDILLAHGWVREADLTAALSAQWGAEAVDLERHPPDPRLIDALGPERCLREGILPWRRAGGATVIATARPEDFAWIRATLPEGFGPVVMALAGETALHAALLATRQTALIRRAETRVPLAESCRARNDEALNRRIVAGAVALAALLLLAPSAVMTALFSWAVLALALGTALRLAAFAAVLRAEERKPVFLRSGAPARLPVVSVMVPLFGERDIAGRLVGRLGRLRYPRELLDILLVVEEEDAATRAALASASLPAWMRVVTVPAGPIRTKPRALNFALDFCRGAIVGVYDAEDAPEPDQIHKVVRRFRDAGPEVACLQGILDYYNPRTNWLARCFTIEYAAWFRVVLPGLARLGLVVPLGGTTLFFRRAALEALGGWDAHNVTEDADLGLRLARHGYRTELVPTVTGEEANCRPLPWIRQRSRWLKGYAMTWAVHMRAPRLLWRQLGAWRFLGVQVLFLGTLSQFVLAPLLWSFWIVAFGLWHPVAALLPPAGPGLLFALFLVSEAASIGIGLWAVRGRSHRHLLKWVPSLHLYFPLAALAAWKALHELVARPFFWDKTAHGLFDDQAAAALPDPAAVPLPAVAAPSR